jgi:hypothetical protein
MARRSGNDEAMENAMRPRRLPIDLLRRSEVSTMQLRLGQVLVDAGVLTGQQVRSILANQRTSGRPFGVLAEQMFGIDPAHIEDAWAEQYAKLTRKIDPTSERIDDDARHLVSRRQAWQFRIIPIRFEGDELIVATTQQNLRRALRFATRVLSMPVYFVMATPESLGAALTRHYPMPGMTAHSINDDGMDLLLGRTG